MAMPQKMLLGLFAISALLAPDSRISAQRDARPETPSAPAGHEVSKTIDTYCSNCHNGRLRSSSGTLLEQFDPARMSADPASWARAYRQLQAGAMPPAGAPRPDRATIAAALVSIEQGLATLGTPPSPDNREIATRLARLLWNSAPDAALQQDAQRNRLRDPATLERHIQRMLADDRAQAFVSRFFVPWLQLDALGNSDPDRKYFPDYDVSLRDSLARETELFVLSQLREDRDPIDLWSADYTFVNEQTARHYGIPGVTGPEFQRVSLPTPERAGLLGHGSIMMVTSRHQHGVDAAYTTPATRAKWVRLRYFGAPLPNGFPGAQPVKPELPITPQTRTLPAEPCGNCHRNFFPLGYALENFDPLGRWRTDDQMGPVDTSGAFVDGTPMNGVLGLREVLLQYPDAFRTTMTEGLLVYAATGSAGSAAPSPETLVRARQILRRLPNPRWSTLIAAIVHG